MTLEDQPSTVTMDPALWGQIDRLITARVDERMQSLREDLDRRGPANRATLVAFSGDMDKLLAAFVIAAGAATMGMEVSMYFTFWGLTVLKKRTCFKGKPFLDKLTALMLPAGPDHLGTSRLNLMGMGPAFFGYVMKKRNVASLRDLIDMAKASGVRLIACQMAMEVMGITRDELIGDLEFGGVATYLADAGDARITLFI